MSTMHYLGCGFMRLPITARGEVYLTAKKAMKRVCDACHSGAAADGHTHHRKHWL